MRILLDLQAAQGRSRFRGIGRYSLSLAQSIVRHRGEHEVIVALSDLNPATIDPVRRAFDGLLPQENIRVWQAAGPVRAHQPANGWRRTVAQQLREAFLASLRPDIIHVPSILEGYYGEVVATIGPLTASIVTTVTLHDLIPLLNPETYLTPDRGFELYYRETLNHLKRADGWLAVSESAAREGQEVLGLASEYVVNVSSASDSIFRRISISREDEEAIRQRIGLTKPFVMYSGGADVRKNLDRLIRAYALLPPGLRAGHQLALVGPMPQTESSKRTARAAGLAAGELVFTGFVEDADLVRLYNLCKLFVLPSTHEGFGLTALEAMASGAPVIGSNTTSIPEVIGWRDALFDPLDELAIAAKIEQGLTDDVFRTELIRRAPARAREFSWDKTGERALQTFERIHAARRPGKRRLAGGAARQIDRLINQIARSAVGQPSDQDLLRTARAIARNHAQPPKQILLDVSQLIQGDRKTGVQRVVRNLLEWLPRLAPPDYRVAPVHATLQRPGYRYASVTGDARSGRIPHDAPIEVNPGDIFLGLDLSYKEVLAQAGFLGELRRLGVRVYFVVYDLLPVLMPTKFRAGINDRHERWLGVVATCDGAICISRSVGDELALWLKSNSAPRHRPFRIGWFHPGSEHESSGLAVPSSDEVNRVMKEITARPAFLVVGTLEPRKGHAQALAAFDQLWSEGADVNLVFAGQQGWQMKDLVASVKRHPEIDRRLFWLEGLSDEDLATLYAASSCLLMVSEGEGFGLPLVEAAEHGTSILARDIPVFREVAGNNALYFSGLEPSDVTRAVRRWQQLTVQEALPSSREIMRLSWEESASEVLEILLLNGGNHIRVVPTERISA